MDKTLNPFVSVIMPVYNCQQFVSEAIESILKQTFSNFEFIIVDDKSTDNTRIVIESYPDPRIILITNSKNLGISKCLNAGLDIAKGKYVARMDGDDVSMITRFEKQVAYLEKNPDVILCGTWFTYSNTKDINKLPINHDDIKLAMLNNNALAHPTVMLRTTALNRNNLSYDYNFEPAEDYDLWTKLIDFGKVYNIPESLLYYRVHECQISTKEIKAQQEKTVVVKKRLFLSVLNSYTAEEEKCYSVIINQLQPKDRKQIRTIIDLLDTIIIQNKKKLLFKEPEFSLLIRNKKCGFFRTYFQNQSCYNLKTLYEYVKLSDTSKYLNNRERIIFYLKCVIFWEPEVSNLH